MAAIMGFPVKLLFSSRLYVCTGGWSALNDAAISGAEFSTMEQVDRGAPQPRGRSTQLTARLCERGTEYGRLFRFAHHVSHAC